MAEKQRFFVNIGGQRWCTFHAPVTAYTDAMGIALGVGVTLPDGHRATSIGTFADYGIVQVRLKLSTGKTIIRLCDADMLASAIADLPGAVYPPAGATILEVAPVRKNVLV